MKILRFSFYILIFFIFSISSYSTPTLPDPGTKSATTYTAINYDYGPRNVTTGTNPHIGLDYDIRTGNKAYAVESGNVLNISNLGTKYAQIKIGNWNYIHIEDNSTIIQGYVKGSIDNSDSANLIPKENIIVFREIIDGLTETKKALSTQIFSNDPELNIFNDPIGTPVTVSTTVFQKEWIFVSRGGDMGNHLHLDYNGGAKNPLKYVAHKDIQNPIIWPKYKYIDSNNQAQNFSDNTLYNIGTKPVILQEGINIRTDKDLNIAEIGVRQINRTIYASMNKWTYEPATTQGVVNTTTGRGRTIYKKATETEIAHAIEGGIYPLAGMSNESFDFFKYRWHTLDSVSGLAKALVNSDAMWQDGIYSIKMEAEDITGHKTTKNETKVLDNFLPYLKKAQIIKNSDNEIRYFKQWIFDGTNLTCPGPSIDKTIGNGNYTIKLEFSEPVVNPEFFIPSLDGLTLSSNEFDGNQKNFEAALVINEESTIQDGQHTMSVFAFDSAWNALLALNSEATIINPATQLTRDAAGNMQGTVGTDTSVNFTINRAPPKITYLNTEDNPHFVCEGSDNCGSPENPKDILWIPSKFKFEDTSGLKEAKIYKGNFGELYQTRTFTDIETAIETFTLEEGKTYTMVAKDKRVGWIFVT